MQRSCWLRSHCVSGAAHHTGCRQCTACIRELVWVYTNVLGAAAGRQRLSVLCGRGGGSIPRAKNVRVLHFPAGIFMGADKRFSEYTTTAVDACGRAALMCQSLSCSWSAHLYVALAQFPLHLFSKIHVYTWRVTKCLHGPTTS